MGRREREGEGEDKGRILGDGGEICTGRGGRSKGRTAEPLGFKKVGKVGG